MAPLQSHTPHNSTIAPCIVAGFASSEPHSTSSHAFAFILPSNSMSPRTLSHLGSHVRGRYWFEQVGNRAESAFDEPMKSSPSARSVCRWRWESDETSEARDSRVREEVESWQAMRECESECEKVHTGEFKSTTGQVYSVHERGFLYMLCYNHQSSQGLFTVIRKYVT